MRNTVVDTATHIIDPPIWKRVLVMPPYDLRVQARTLEGDKYRLSHYRTTWTYRTWSR